MSACRHRHERLSGNQPLQQKCALNLIEDSHRAVASECAQHASCQYFFVALLEELKCYSLILAMTERKDGVFGFRHAFNRDSPGSRVISHAREVITHASMRRYRKCPRRIVGVKETVEGLVAQLRLTLFLPRDLRCLVADVPDPISDFRRHVDRDDARWSRVGHRLGVAANHQVRGDRCRDVVHGSEFEAVEIDSVNLPGRPTHDANSHQARSARRGVRSSARFCASGSAHRGKPRDEIPLGIDHS